jgi:hypothetical protein
VSHREIDVRRSSASRRPPDVVQPAIVGDVDHVLGICASAVVCFEVTECRRGGARRRDIPTLDRSYARPIELI